MWRSRVVHQRALPLLLAAIPVASSLIAPVLVHAVDIATSTSVAGEEVSSVFDKAKPAVIKVRSGDQSFVLAGTGFFIDGHGTVLTSSTVVGTNATAKVEINGVQMDAKVLGSDARSGLAMLKVAYDGTSFLTLSHSTDLRTGYGVVAIGYPLDLPASPSQGLISGFDVRYMNQFFSTTHIHVSAPLTPGEVGGPLLNMRGEVIGLVVPSPDDGRSIYALPVEAVQKIITDFNQYGRAKHGWVGVNVVEVPDTDHDGRTVRVVQVEHGTPASKSGLQAGDIVMRIDSREIYRPSDVLDASFFSRVGGNLNVVVRRDAKLLNYTFAVIERPQNHFVPTQPVAHDPDSQTQPVVVNRAIPNSP